MVEVSMMSRSQRWALPVSLGLGTAFVLALTSTSAAAPLAGGGDPPRPGPSTGDGDDWTGTGFVRRATGLSAEAREALILDFVERGAMPSSLQALRPVTVSEHEDTATVWVMPDVFAVGIDGDRFRPALTARTAQLVADALGMVLPTEKIVRLTWNAADAKVPLRGFGAPRDSFARHVESDRAIADRITRAGARESDFIAGHSKDYVVGAPRRRNPDHIANYGAWDAQGARIQPSSGRAHGLGYRDYSQRVRLVSAQVDVDGVRRPLAEVLLDATIARLLHDEGAVSASALRYPV
jgi:hypothetical protein